MKSQRVTCDLLFVYGTLRQKAENPLRQHFGAGTQLIGPAWLPGALYRIAHYPGAVVTSNPADRVYGELCRIHSPSILLALLDEYEECGPHAPAPAEYRRVVRTVTGANGQQYAAWVYLYNRPVTGLLRIPSGDFLNP